MISGELVRLVLLLKDISSKDVVIYKVFKGEFQPNMLVRLETRRK